MKLFIYLSIFLFVINCTTEQVEDSPKPEPTAEEERSDRRRGRGNRGSSGKCCPCPTNNPNSDYKLAEITFPGNPPRVLHWFRGPKYRYHTGFNPGASGQSNPGQDFLLRIYQLEDENTFVFLNKEQIQWETEKRYFLYVDGTRFELQRAQWSWTEYTQNGIDHIMFKASEDLVMANLPQTVTVHIASEKSGQCSYYYPSPEE